MSRTAMRLIRTHASGPSRTLAAPASDEPIARDVKRLLGVRPRRLPAYLLYDALGSALFDAICQLPWYPITRAELALLRLHRRAILEAAGRRARLVELGPGNGEKLATLLKPGAGERVATRDVHLVDVSSAALEHAAARLREVPGTSVTSHVARYEDGLREVTAMRREHETVLACFLGSNIGNFDPEEADTLLAAVRASLRRGDTLLLGVDLVKPEERLRAAYDDPLGVTAAFDANVLVRLNRDLGADFRLDRFAHEARWNAQARRVEMHLVSLCRQRVHVPGADLDVDLEAGESIWTESSYKYEPDGVTDLLMRAGFSPVASWQDDEAGFLLTLATAR